MQTLLYRASPFEEHKPHQRGRGNPGKVFIPVIISFDLHDVHARLPELIGELLPDEEVKQLSRLGHHHLVACHIVQSLKEFLQIINSELFNTFIMIKVECEPHHNHSGQCSRTQWFGGLDQDSGSPKGRRYR